MLVAGVPLKKPPSKSGSGEPLVPARLDIRLSSRPVITSALCRQACPMSSSWKARCCRAYRPRFDLPAILALAEAGWLGIFAAAEFYADPPLVVVDLQGMDLHCGLWTPSGCILPAALRPQTCRDYFCRLPAAKFDADFCEAYREYLAVFDLVNRCNEEFTGLWSRAGDLLPRSLRVVGGPKGVFFDVRPLETLLEEYRGYQQCLRDRVREYLGVEEITCSINLKH